MFHVELQPGTRGKHWACMRPLCGHDEVAIEGTSSIDATALLDRLLVEAPGSVGPGAASDLAVCDCDRLCAALYVEYFGDRVESTIDCATCSQSFDLGFSLREFAADLPRREARMKPDADGAFALPDGRRFRLPTARDQREVLGLEEAAAVSALLERCVVEGDPQTDPEAVEAAMEQAGAVLDADLEAACPDCGDARTVRFEMQSYLLRALAFERRFLVHEVHRIAMTYGWGFGEILGLSREDRRMYVRLIESDLSARRRQRS